MFWLDIDTIKYNICDVSLSTCVSPAQDRRLDHVTSWRPPSVMVSLIADCKSQLQHSVLLSQGACKTFFLSLKTFTKFKEEMPLGKLINWYKIEHDRFDLFKSPRAELWRSKDINIELPSLPSTAVNFLLEHGQGTSRTDRQSNSFYSLFLSGSILTPYFPPEAVARGSIHSTSQNKAERLTNYLHRSLQFI